MGGTTAKAALVEDGQFAARQLVRGRRRHQRRRPTAQGRRLPRCSVPAIDIAEVGAGGGSIVAARRGRRAAASGRESAGADPGPACYGRGGTEPTVTDANVVLGFINPTALAGGAPADRRGARRAPCCRRRSRRPLGLSRRGGGVRRAPGRQRHHGARAPGRIDRARAATRATSPASRSAATGRCTRPTLARAARDPTHAGATRRPACSARSACCFRTSSTTTSAPSCARSTPRRARRVDGAVRAARGGRRDGRSQARAYASGDHRFRAIGRPALRGANSELTVPYPAAGAAPTELRASFDARARAALRPRFRRRADRDRQPAPHRARASRERRRAHRCAVARAGTHVAEHGARGVYFGPEVGCVPTPVVGRCDLDANAPGPAARRGVRQHDRRAARRRARDAIGVGHVIEIELAIMTADVAQQRPQPPAPSARSLRARADQERARRARRRDGADDLRAPRTRSSSRRRWTSRPRCSSPTAS